MRVLHLGCGRKKYTGAELAQYVGLQMDGLADAEIRHLDADPRLQPDMVCRLGTDRIPVADNSIDLIVAWHVLEHIGQQGQSFDWFYAWEEMYRVLTPEGLLYAESPYYTSIWAWSDPTHTRSLSEHAFLFFMQDAYRVPGSMISPYRIACDFSWIGIAGMEKGWRVLQDQVEPKHQSIRFMLKAKKPLMPWWKDLA